jgi:hypothetical protein
MVGPTTRSHKSSLPAQLEGWQQARTLPSRKGGWQHFWTRLGQFGWPAGGDVTIVRRTFPGQTGELSLADIVHCRQCSSLKVLYIYS